MSSSKEGSFVEDIEEGEISDESQSVEEISEIDFKQETKAKVVSSTTTSGGGQEEEEDEESDSNTMVWMGDMLKYPGSSNYGSGLYNFAWAQAVQNKPLNQSLREFANKSRQENEQQQQQQQQQLTNKREKGAAMTSKQVCSVIIDDSSEEVDNNKLQDKEEGELEEGEIELESDMTITTKQNSHLETALNDRGFEKRLNSVKDSLNNVTVNNAENSIDAACSQLRTSLDSLQSIVSERGVSAVGTLVDQAFAGIQAVNSAFNSLDLTRKEQNKEDLLRLLSHVKGQLPSLFSPEQLKEIQATMKSIDLPPVSSGVKDMEVEEELWVTSAVNNELGILGEKPQLLESGILGEKPGPVLDSTKKGLLEPISVKFGEQNSSTMGLEILKQGFLSVNRGRGNFGPLLDLHRDHDVDSLPSPTREAPPPLYLREQNFMGVNNSKPESISKVAKRSEDASMHHYETDALKAVSSYQQKFGRTSFHLSNRLPSPTPSEESDGGDGDSNGEVSSSFNVGKVRAFDGHMPLQVVGSVAPHTDKASIQRQVPDKAMGLTTSIPNPHIRASLKSRDPRLRRANLEVAPLDVNAYPLLRDTSRTQLVEGVINLRKNKNFGEIAVDGQTLKRPKNGLADWEVRRDIQMPRGGGWMENCSTAGTPVIDKIRSSESIGTDPCNSKYDGKRNATTTGTFNAETSGTGKVPVIGTTASVSMPSLLKDIAVNPTMLVQLIMEQQRLATQTQKSTNSLQSTTPDFTSSRTTGVGPLLNVAPSKSYGSEQKPVEKPLMLSQTMSTVPHSESEKIRMKPRDPRWILHKFQKDENMVSEHFKTNGAATMATQGNKDNPNIRQQSEQSQAASLPSQSSPSPDIALQFTENLRNLADIISSQSTDSVSTVGQSGSSSQSVQVKNVIADTGISVADSKDLKSGTVLTPEGAIETSQSQNTWGEVEHLFQGYDDQQKAAIQRERARRIEEQNKMFAAKKLCLVLDLDHTLLNSAKFVEVEPVHEDILRKKEEQDREKPQRHLFRFSHMGMWTKLRPGIWTFLEKASKLYELHLYTMGNKVYATEMAKVLDPSGVLFSGRVISKGDEGDPFDADDKLPKSKDLDGVLGMESAVVIIDDSVKVWPHNKLNLILVERYTYFPCSRRQFGLPGPSLLEIDHDERPEDGTLASSLTVIERIHQIFFSNPSLHEVDVRNILAEEQRKILAGCRILFSRIFPVGEAKPHQHPLWQTAEQFGAVCTTQIDNLVTHVVANSLGTDKVNWALSTGRFVVHPGWVEASALLYRRANENDFVVKINLP